MRRHRNTATGRLERILESEWREAVNRRDRGTCRIGGDTWAEGCNAAHIIARSQSLNVKFLLANGLTVFHELDTYYTNRPKEWVACCVTLIGADEYARLLTLARIKVYSPGPSWFEAQRAQLDADLQKILSSPVGDFPTDVPVKIGRVGNAA